MLDCTIEHDHRASDAVEAGYTCAGSPSVCTPGGCGDGVRTGVTAVVPHGGNVFQDKVPGAVFVGNAFGKLAGSTQVEELGEIETPILLTGTLAVPRVADAVMDYMLALPGNENVQSINPLVEASWPETAPGA